MWTISKAVVGTRPAFLLGAVAVILALATGAVAKKPDKPAQSASVIAHVPLEGAVASQMYLQAQGDKRYLYIDQGTDQGYTVVDITKAAQPNILKRATSGKVQVVGPDLALAEAPDQSKTVARSHVPTESVTVLDTSDPANPKTIQTFQGVTSVLQDNGRGLIFLTNNEGLWILQQTVARMRPARKKQPCNSESAISAMPPDCE
jgi:hypothetical protein